MRPRGGGSNGKAVPAACIYLFTGEGAHSTQTDTSQLKLSSAWPAVEAALEALGLGGAEPFLKQHLGNHEAPHSPLVTTILNLLNEALWRAAGHVPKVVIGHSFGEVAAACSSGMLTAEEALRTAYTLAEIGAQLKGAMVHNCSAVSDAFLPC